MNPISFFCLLDVVTFFFYPNSLVLYLCHSEKKSFCRFTIMQAFCSSISLKNIFLVTCSNRFRLKIESSWKMLVQNDSRVLVVLSPSRSFLFFILGGMEKT